ncbi:hypothetical protein NXS15_00400 [Mycoplasma sp. CSL7475-4]|uniref:HinT-interacting membrane complex protein P80 n=1 Tax=Mycoplasma sp. CSL7475-4 TaxID=2973942 RepID=UPI00216AB882|nr:hypothetical protein [Mycoplasma sp. CSL7475-4]MCS4536592.1 hypothetical protein [Mycoplasma sp. CSL7475-4]
MGKKKETFFERLTRKNAQQEDSQNPKSPKKKNWKFWVIASSIAATVASGITIPLVANSLVKKYNDPLKNDTVVFHFKTPDENSKSIGFNLGDVLKNSSTDEKSNPKLMLDNAFKSAIFYLYNKEVKASKEYQRLWNASLKTNEKERTDIALKPIEELTKKHKDLLLDIKEQMIKTFGFSKWEQAFNDFLIKNFQGAKSINEAVTLRVYDEIKKDALRRFQLNTQFNIDDIDRVAKTTIYKLDENGKPTNQVLYEVGQRVFPFFKKNVNYFEIDQIKEKMTFMTNSYVVDEENYAEYKDASKFIDFYLSNDNPFLISQFTLPGIAPAKKEEGKEAKWTIDREAFKRLMFYWPIDNENAPFKAETSFEKVKNTFKSYDEFVKEATENKSTTLNKEIADYGTLLSVIALDDQSIKSNWGSEGLVSITGLLTSKNDKTLQAFSVFDNLVLGNDSSKDVDLFKTLSDIRTNIIQYLGLEDPKDAVASAQSKEEAQTKIADFNKEIIKAFDEASDVKKEGIYQDKYNELVVKPIIQLFEDSTNNKISTFYTLHGSAKTKVILTSKGITLVDVKQLSQLNNGNSQSNEEIIKEMIKSDFLLSNKYKSSANGNKYNALNLINRSMDMSEIVLEDMLKDDNFKTFMKSDYFVTDKSDKSITYKFVDKITDNEIDEIIKLNVNVLNANKHKKSLDLVKGVESWMKQRAEDGYDSNFEINQGKVYFTHNNDSYTKDASAIIYETLKTITKAGK